MIAESLKRRHSGTDNQPATKVRVLCDRTLKANRGAENNPEGKRFKKRSLSSVIEEDSDDTENIASRWHNPKRQRKRELSEPVDNHTMQIKSGAQYHQSPAKKAKSNKSQAALQVQSKPEVVRILIEIKRSFAVFFVVRKKTLFFGKCVRIRK